MKNIRAEKKSARVKGMIDENTGLVNHFFQENLWRRMKKRNHVQASIVPNV